MNIKQNILVVEDEPKVATFIKKGLEKSAFMADIAKDGVMGNKMALKNNYNALIVDINLPRMNGYELCKLVRQKKPGVPILILSALDSLDDKLLGFDIGADDYLVKPFEFSELLARLKSLLKRASVPALTNNLVTIGDLETDMDKKEVRRAGKRIDLTAKEYYLLEYLVKNRDRVVSRAELAEKVWGINFDSGTNVIDVYINFLRKKIDKDHEKKLIHTYIGIGYTLKEEA